MLVTPLNLDKERVITFAKARSTGRAWTWRHGLLPVVVGMCLMLSGLALLLAMVIRLIEPGLLLSLSAYSGVFGGMLLGLAGIAGKVQNRK